MKTKEERLKEIKNDHPSIIMETTELCIYLKVHRHTLENYQKLGLEKLGRNKWYLPDVIYWIKHILPNIKQ